LSGYKRIIDGWFSGSRLSKSGGEVITSTPGFSSKQEHIHPWARISTPEQKYPPLSSWPAKHNSTRPALTPKPGLQHWLPLHSGAGVNNVPQCTTKHTSVEVEWMIL